MFMQNSNFSKQKQQPERSKKVDLPGYLSKSATKAKRGLLIRTYWGRGNSYKKILHITILGVTALFVFTGIASRVSEISASRVSLSDDYGLGANVDTLQQGIGIQIVKKVDPINFEVTNYTIVEGDTLDSVSEKFAISKETIKWANPAKIDYYKETLKPGDTIVLPQINGVLYEVKEGDTLDSVLSKTEGNRFEVVELNRLAENNYNLIVGNRLLIPNGKLPPPPQAPVFRYLYPTNAGVNVATNVNYAKLNDIAFVNPLSNPSCGGYVWNRGFTSSYYFLGHDGVDLGKFGGCPIRAAANGTVIFAGLSGGGEGYNVRIDHGNGVQTLYYHGSGDFYQGVYVGAQVAAGQEIMYMGCSGNCFGTHLHLSLRVDGIFVDPSSYIPY